MFLKGLCALTLTVCFRNIARKSDRTIRTYPEKPDVRHISSQNFTLWSAFPPDKIMMVQNLRQNDLVRRHSFAESILEWLTEDIVLFMSDKAYFHIWDRKQTEFVLCTRKICKNYTAREW